jgi:hypothetical protein
LVHVVDSLLENRRSFEQEACPLFLTHWGFINPAGIDDLIPSGVIIMKQSLSKKTLTLWFNREARLSAAKQLIRATWITPGLAAYFAQGRNSLMALAAIVLSWFVLQVCAHVILSLEDKATDAPDKPDRKSVKPKPLILGQAGSTAAVKKKIATKQGLKITDNQRNV